MGCWGLLGWLLLVMKWIIPENSLRLAPVRKIYSARIDSYSVLLSKEFQTPRKSGTNAYATLTELGI